MKLLKNNIKMNKNYSGLTSVGSEIISSNVQTKRNLLFSAGKPPQLVVKSYKITNDTSIQDIKSLRNNNNNNISEEKPDIKLSNSNTNIKNFTNINNINDISKSKESKRESSLNLSNIKYKDGYILKDAINSNPGYGLWSIKTPVNDLTKKEEKEIKSNLLEESKNINIINNNKIVFNDEELNYKYTKFFDEDKKQNLKNKKLIQKLNNKLSDLEKKYMKALSNYQEKKSLCENAIKMRKEYEEMLENNKMEIELIKEKTKEVYNENKIVENALTNAKNEIDRLLNVMKEDDKNMDILDINFEQRLKKEEDERNKLREIIKNKEEQILILQEQTKFITTNTFFEDEAIGNESRKDFEIKKLKEMILNMHLKISGLKKEIYNNKEEMKKLNKVLKYKNMRDEYQRLNINNLFYAVEENEQKEQKNNRLLKNQNEIIKHLNEHLRKQYNIVTSKKLHKSFSQEILLNKSNI